jgi:hypothetical protein
MEAQMNVIEISDDAVTSLGILLHGRQYVIGDDGRLCVVCVDGFARWIGDELDELFDCGLVTDVDGVIVLSENARYWYNRFQKRKRK